MKNSTPCSSLTGFTPLESTSQHTQDVRAGSLTGFTLIETVVVVALSVIALLALVNLFMVFNSIYGYEQAFIASAGSASNTVNALEASVLPAEQVLTSYNFSGTTYTSTTTSLVLQIPSIDSSGNIVSGAKDYVAFYASSTKLYRLVSANAQSVRVSGRTQLSASLLSISFTYDNADVTRSTSVTADVQTRAQYKQQVLQSRLTEQLYLRNYFPL
jgi:hypothetical protein